MTLKTLNGFAVMIALTLAFSGCVKDRITKTYRIYEPVYKSVELARAEIRSEAAHLIKTPGKIFVRGNYIFLNEIDKGVHIIDNSNPAAPSTVSFINIAGNQDIAVKGDILYADQFSDLVTIDISNPLKAQVKKILPAAFPDRVYANGLRPDGQQYIVDYRWKDTTVTVTDQLGGWWPMNCTSCLYNSVGSGGSTPTAPAGIAGSTARFSLVNNTLYAVGSSTLGTFNLSNPEDPQFVKRSNVGLNIETIFPLNDKLLMGSTNGVFIYDIQTPENPQRLSQFSHVTACDPVVAQNNTAYVTLRSGARCSSAGNQLDILDISSLTNPTLIKTYALNNPRGLSIRNKLLFICDDGLKVFNAEDPRNLKLVDHKKGFESQDIIALANLAIVVTKDGILQYSYSAEGNLSLVGSKHWDN